MTDYDIKIFVAPKGGLLADACLARNFNSPLCSRYAVFTRAANFPFAEVFLNDGMKKIPVFVLLIYRLL